MPTLKAKLQTPEARLSGALCTIPSAVVAQALAAAGLDTIVVDLEHGAVDFAAAHEMIAATAGTGCAPLVRVSENDPTQVKRALDLGAEGIIFPLIRTAEDAAEAVAAMRYPPAGVRGFGPFLAHSRWQTTLMDYSASVGDHLVCCLTIETAEAVENIEEICAIPGVDIVVPAPFDLSTDLGLMGQFDHPDFVAAVQKVEKAAQAAGLPLGGVGLAEAQARSQFARGYRLLVGFDVLWLRAKAGELRGWCAAD